MIAKKNNIILGKTQKKKYIFAVKYLVPKTKPYSPKKIITKGPPLYSMLKPLINSLSPSAKSNGARFDSATTQIHHIGIEKIPGFTTLLLILPLWYRVNIEKIKREKIISYLTP